MSTRCNIEFYDGPITTEVSEPAARLYKHSDGYPENGILPLLKATFQACDKGFGLYGRRTSDPEWCAAEFISMHRDRGGGNIYVSQQNHGDIEYLYRVVCLPETWEVLIFQPEYDKQYDITGYKQIAHKQFRARKRGRNVT